jgi:PAS domain S-box-containing protein
LFVSAPDVPTEYLTDHDIVALAETSTALAASMPGLGLWRVRSDGFVWWSPAQYALFGLNPEAGVPRPADLFRMYHPDDANIVAKALRDCFKTSEPALLHYRVVRRDGQVRHLNSRHVRLPPDSEGRLIVVGVDTDVTDRDAEFQQLLESERLFRFVADNTRDLIVRYSRNAELTYLSRACKTVLGYEPDDLIGRQTLDLLHPDDVRRAVADTQAMFESGEAMAGPPCEYRFQHKDGRWIWLESHPRLVRNGAGDIVEQINVVRDVTLRRLAEDEAADARAQAQAAAAVKSEFLANMSHELRTPLTSIVGFSRLIGAGGALSATDRRYVELVRTASETLLAVVDDILDFSKLEAGAVKLLPEPFSVADLIGGVVALMNDQARAKGLALTAHVAEDALLSGDAARLRQVLLNLVGNAIKFTEAGSVAIEAGCTAEQAGSRLLISVRDTGIGVPADQQAAVFERFSQLDSSNARRFGGAGLGLTISRRLMELMGGAVGLRSDGETGSYFWIDVVLPRADRADSSMGAGPEQALDRPIRILLAEDNAANRLLISALLEPFALELDVAENGEQAVAAATRRAYDLILMDMQMPVMDGLTACRAIRALGGRAGAVPILALTANVLPEQVEQCLSAGMTAHLAKPINPQALFAAIDRHALRVDLARAA